MPPLVSICLPCLNARPFLEPRMESILAQTVRDWELIVCDSFSSDGSWEYFQKFKDDPRIRLHQVQREGIYAGWNECLRRATGEYVYIATADDTCSPDLLENMVGALEGMKNEECRMKNDKVRKNEHGPTTRQPETRQPARPVDMAVCDFDFIDEQGKVIDPPPRGTARAFYGDWLARPHLRSGLLELLVHLCVDISWTTITAVCFRRRLLEKTGLFRPDVGALGDKFWAMKSALNSDTVYVPERLATWRWHGAQASHHQSNRERALCLKVAGETLDECQTLVPAAWRLDEHWRSKLLWGPRRNYLAAYSLDRGAIRRDPLGFLRGCCRAAVHEPRFLARRLATGFSWQCDEIGDDHACLRRLIAEWNVPLPEAI